MIRAIRYCAQPSVRLRPLCAAPVRCVWPVATSLVCNSSPTPNRSRQTPLATWLDHVGLHGVPSFDSPPFSHRWRHRRLDSPVCSSGRFHPPRCSRDECHLPLARRRAWKCHSWLSQAKSTGAITSSPMASPSHDVHDREVRASRGSTPPRYRLVTPTAALTVVLKPLVDFTSRRQLVRHSSQEIRRNTWIKLSTSR